MALKLRRGTDAERQNIVFAKGEPVYVTDTGELYIGDGVTEGGSRIQSGLSAETDPSLGGNLDLAGNNIIGTGNIAINGNITASGTISLGDNVDDDIIVTGRIDGSLIPDVGEVFDIGSSSLSWGNSYFRSVQANEIATDSITVTNINPQDSSAIQINGSLELNNLIADSMQLNNIVPGDSATLQLDGTLELIALTAGSIFVESRVESIDTIVSPMFLGNLEGSVVGSDSTILVDFPTNAITAPNYTTFSNVFNFTSSNTGEVNLFVNSDEDRSVLKLGRTSTSALTPENDTLYGSILFERQDINGFRTTAAIAGTDSSIILVPDSSGNYTDEKNYFKFTTDGYFGVGTQSPSATLDVRGEIVSNSYVQFGSFTTTERNALVSANGMVIYNTTDNKFQGFQNGAWINLDDGSDA